MPPHTSRFFCRRFADLLSGSNWVKIFGTSVCRRQADFLSWLTAFSLRAESISAMFEKRLVHATLMTIPDWLRYAGALTDKARQDVLRSSTVRYRLTSPNFVADLSEFTAH